MNRIPSNKRARIVEIYKENAALLREPKANRLNWIKSLRPVDQAPTLDERAEGTRKGVVRTRSTQIGFTSEALDEENRRVRRELYTVQSGNRQLCALFNQENDEYTDLLGSLQEARRTLCDPNNWNDEFGRNGSDSNGKGHLSKNLQVQIFLTEQEIHKTEGALRSLKSCDEFFELFELISVKTGYEEEMNRLNELLMLNQSIQVPKKAAKKQRLAAEKIRKMEQKCAELERALQKATDDAVNANQFWKKNLSENEKRELLLTSKRRDIVNFQAEILQIEKELNVLNVESS